ncbi:MAG: SBBP repeat-containing protein [Bacteroidota bacterium]
MSVFSLSAQQLPVDWIRSYTARGKCPDRIACILADQQGNAIAAGFAGGERCNRDAFVIKYGTQGDTLWTWTYDSGSKENDEILDMVLDNTGNIYVTGSSEDNPNGISDCFTAKVNASGVQQWLTRYPSPTNAESFGYGIAVDNSGNVYVCGMIDPLSASSDWLVVKYNGSNGAQLWADIYNAPSNFSEEALDIAISPTGNPTACGYSYNSTATGGQNVYVRQLSPTGTVVWSDTYSNPAATGAEQAYGLKFLANGDLVVGASTENGTTDVDAMALRYDASGNRQWATINAYPNDEYILGFAADDSGNVYLAGTEYQNGTINRINNDGTPGWRKKWIGPLNNGSDVFHDVAVDGNGNVYAIGRGVYPGQDYYLNGGMGNQIIAKYSPAGDSLWTYRSADTQNPSMGFAVYASGGKVYAGGFVTDTAFYNENFYTMRIDTSGSPLFERKYNGIGDAVTHGQIVRTDALNNVYCAATVEQFAYQYGFDVVLVKYSPSGQLLWEREYNTPGVNNDTITHMEIDPNGNMVMCISTDSALTKNNYRLSLVTVDPNGTFLDTAWYLPTPTGNTFAKSMLMRNDGSVAIGAVSSFQGGITLRFSQSATLQWLAQIDSTPFAFTRVNSLAAFPNGDIGVAGLVQTGGGNTAKGVVQRFTPAGVRLWSADYDSLNVFDEARDLDVSPSDKVAVVGLSGFSTTGTSALITYDGASGQQLWRKSYNPNTANEFGIKVSFTPAGNIAYLCRGWTGFVARYTTVQYGDTGQFQWATVYSQTASDREPVELVVAPNNTVVTAGWWLDGTTTNANYVLAGYNPNGTVQFTNTWANTSATTSNPDYLRSMTRDNSGSYIVTGESATEFFNQFLYRMVTIKYGTGLVGMEDIETVLQFNDNPFYPNPSASGRFRMIDQGIPFPLTGARVYDSRGSLIQLPRTEQSELDLSSYGSGLFVVYLPQLNRSYRLLVP